VEEDGGSRAAEDVVEAGFGSKDWFCQWKSGSEITLSPGFLLSNS
jgi:hypothetical protein